MNMSATYAPTLKEDPAGADIASHRLLLRAGMIRQMGSGTYTFLPLGQKVLNKVIAIVNEEMDRIGAQQILMPILQPAELWHESGRWDDYGPELMRMTDRHNREVCLGPTHEELITDLVRDELRSYKELPVVLYQTQVKFRDEIRPRFGLLRTREFIMKDAYSFNADEESLDETYKQMEIAYARICERLGLEFRKVEADSGQIGGSETCEFMALADAGESDLVHCTCGYAADAEAAKVGLTIPDAEVHDLEKISTPGVHTIADLAQFLGIGEDATVKALVGTGDDGKIRALFIPGDHELNDIKISGLVPGWRLCTDEEMIEAKLPKGSIGPVGLPEGVICICDESLKGTHAWAVGANDDGYHYLGAEPGRDFTPDAWADLVLAKPGDLCPNCGKPLSGDRGIEVSQVFKLGTKYSASMGATFLDENNEERPFLMGSYGVGVTRSMAAIIEQRNDENGMYWPVSVAPAHVCVLPLSMGDELVEPLAKRIADKLDAAGLEVMLDDRDERAGVKFADADLIGWPYQVVVGKRGAKNGVVEFKDRASGEKVEVAVDEIVAHATAAVEEAMGALEAKTVE
ncbi:MAG: proline--tRNA ligase [Coriobacteriales bacterium]